MDNLYNYIKSMDLDNMSRSKQYYEGLYEFYDGDIPKHILEQFFNGYRIDYVWENLQSHDYKLLQKKILDKFSDIEFINQHDDDKSIFILVYDDESLKDNEEFLNLLSFFNYKIRNIFKDNYDKCNYIIEPIFSKKMNDYVYDKCNGILYHITSKRNVDSILKKGLRIKKVTYQNTPQRIYLFAPGYYISNKNRDVWERQVRRIMPNMDNISILKIDLHKINMSGINFYKDTAMDGDEMIFTYTNIPANCISLVNI